MLKFLIITQRKITSIMQSEMETKNIQTNVLQLSVWEITVSRFERERDRETELSDYNTEQFITVTCISTV